MALLIRLTRLLILVQLLPPPSRRSATPGCGARCKLTPFVLQNMFYFYITRTAYYLTSSTGGGGPGRGALPSPPPVRGELWHWIDPWTVIFGGLESGSGIIPGRRSQHPGLQARHSWAASLLHCLALWPWEGDLTSLSLNVEPLCLPSRYLDKATGAKFKLSSQ